MIQRQGHAQLPGQDQCHEQHRADARPGKRGSGNEERTQQTTAPMPPGQALERCQGRGFTLDQHQHQQRHGADKKRNQRGRQHTGNLLGQLAVDAGLQRQEGACH
ncbi:hypothetical protein D3C78_1685450 [compost metagenome]